MAPGEQTTSVIGARRRFVVGLSVSAALAEREAGPEKRFNMRTAIPKTGIDPMWAVETNPDIPFPAPIDEPALGLMGMWMFGLPARTRTLPSPSPTSPKQLRPARKSPSTPMNARLELQDKILRPTKKSRTALVEHCKTQQTLIAAAESPTGPCRLAHQNPPNATRKNSPGQGHTPICKRNTRTTKPPKSPSAYPLEDPHFYDTFNFKTHASIASPVGHADDVEVHIFDPNGLLDALPAALLGGGLFTCLAALTAKRRPISA